MDRPTELPAHVPLAIATRGEIPESVHYGSVAVADAAGRLLWSAGDCAFPVFTRSTLKPFQALPFVSGDGPARFGFSGEQIALLCASHSGEPRHTAAVADMLRRSGCTVSQLQCGCHVPLHYAATGAAAPAGLASSPLHHNCSGKHAGFLAWCRQHGAPVDNYLDPQHPLQQAIRRTVAELAGCTEGDLPMGVDGCGAPNYGLPLVRLARLYARLAAPSGADAAEAALAILRAAMRAHPEMVSGEGRDDLLLARVAPWIAKGGAEGVQALGVAERGIGIAIKIADGGPRALRIVIAAVLAQLGLWPTAGGTDVLEPWRRVELRNHAGRLTGHLLPVVELRRR